MTPPTLSTPSFRETDFGHYIRHYASLLWRWKLWIIIATPLAIAVAIIALLKTSNFLPKLEATALIGMEPMAGMVDIVISESVTDESTHSKLIKSRSFLQDIVTTLSLRLVLKKFSRNEIFDSVHVDTTAPNGSFAFEIDKDNAAKYSLFLKGKFFGRTIVERGTIAELATLTLPGTRLFFNAAFLKNPHNFFFAIISNRMAVESLFGSLAISQPTARMRQTPSFGISITGIDYQLIALTANTVADKYVEKNMNIRRNRSASARDILEKQLEKAKKELNDSEQRLKNFRSANPTVGLTQIAGDMVTQLGETEIEKGRTGSTLYGARVLQKKLITSSPEDHLNAAREVIVFLTANGSTSGPVLDAELTRLLIEQREYQRSYDKGHPIFIQNQNTINNLLVKATNELDAFIKNQDVQQSQLSSRMGSYLDKMRRLPVKELELTQLLRQQQVNADIYSKILDQFNRAKVSDVMDMSDVYVMDPAVSPIPPPPDMKKILALCLLIGLGFIFGPMVLVDMVSQTVRTEQELRRLLPLTVLECIPRISVRRRKKATPTGIHFDKKADASAAANPENHSRSKLLANEFEQEFKQEYVRELFRSLRTKIQLGLQEVTNKSFIVTSLEAGAGKSTIVSNLAITFARRNATTLLIDGDLRMGTVHRFFGIQQTPGLSEFLDSDAPITDAAVTSLILKTAIPTLNIIPAGRYVPNSTELLTLPRFRELKNMISKRYDYVIFDSPPIGLTADAVSVIDAFSRYVLIVKAGKTNVVDLKKKIAEYPMFGAKVLGLVLNFAALDSKLRYYKYSKYYYSA